MTRFQTSLDRYLTSEPEDDFTPWCEATTELIADDVYKQMEVTDLIQGLLEDKWLQNLCNGGKSPEEAARIIERAFKLYILRSNIYEFMQKLLACPTLEHSYQNRKLGIRYKGQHVWHWFDIWYNDTKFYIDFDHSYSMNTGETKKGFRHGRQVKLTISSKLKFIF